MARELGPQGITCVSFHPGWVRTDMGGADAPLAAAEAAAALLRTLDGLGPLDGGRFLDGAGHSLPW